MAPSIFQAVLAALGILGLAFAAPATNQKRALNGQCTQFFFPVSASAPNFQLTNVPSNLDDPTVVEDYVISSVSAEGGALLGTLGKVATNGTYTMCALYCTPNQVGAGRANTLQYLQHAITMRKEYWNGLTYPSGFDGTEYSYIATLLNNGYYVLAVDNLGAGQSDHPDPVLVTQQTLQVEVIHQILQKARAGTIGGPVQNKAFSTIIYTGHSYGSICGNGIATHHPADVDAFVFTGYSGQFVLGGVPLASGILLPADTQAARFKSLAPGYLAMSSEMARAEALETSPNTRGGFDPAIPAYEFAHEDTGSIGEIATLLYGVGPADSFTGHVLTVTGQYDAICCNVPPTPNCGSGPSSLPAQAGAFFPKAKDYTYYIPADTGHSAFLHYTAPATFEYIMNYLASKGY